MNSVVIMTLKIGSHLSQSVINRQVTLRAGNKRYRSNEIHGAAED